ncbi:MAG: hypothetical protein ACOCU2_00205 [Bacillota bacterium]
MKHIPNVNTLKALYDTVLTRHKETHDTIQTFHDTFTQNNTTIKDNLANTIAQHDETLKKIKDTHKAHIKSLETTHQTTLDEFNKERQTLEKNTKTALKALDADHQKTLNTCQLKEEKIKSDYQIALKNTEDTYKRIQAQHDKTIEDATKRFYEHTIQLEKETEIELAKIDNEAKQKDLAFSHELDQVKEKNTKALNKINTTITTLKTTFTKTLETLLKSKEDAIKPLDEDIENLKKEHASALEKTTTQFDAQIAKKTKFKNEKEKINDKAEASRFNKEIKQAKKDKEDTLKTLKETQQNELDPYIKDKDHTIQKHNTTIAKAKEQFLLDLREALIKRQTIKTNDLIQTNRLNLEHLKTEANHTYLKNTKNIDYDIQLINFNQTLEEARLLNDKNTNLINPNERIEQNDAKTTLDLETNALTAKRKSKTKEYKIYTDIKNTELDIDLANLDFEQTKTTNNYQYSLALANINLKRDRIKEDMNKETSLINHYYMHARNYTALKSDVTKAYNPSINSIAKAFKTHQIELYTTMLKQAEVMHDTIIEDIETTYKAEVTIYQSALKSITTEHDKIIKDLTNKQALERNTDLEKIEALDPKKDKQRIKKLKATLQEKQASHDQAVAIKKRELAQQRTIYETIIEHIKTFKMHSIEEADTLLMHIKDQTESAINMVKDTTSKTHAIYDDMYYEIKHSADLFNTFQLQRKDETIEKAEHYKSTRLTTQEHQEANITKTRDEKNYIATTKNENTLKTFQQQIESFKEDLKDTLSSIQETKEATDKDIEHQHQKEHRRLTHIIEKIEREYAQNLKTLTDEKRQEKDACFAKKDQEEETLKHTLEMRDKEKTRYENERNAILKDDIDRYTKTIDTTIHAIQKDPINTLTQDEIQTIDTVISDT